MSPAANKEWPNLRPFSTGSPSAGPAGRAAVRRDTPARLVAAGAACFMVSDALLAINRFVLPLPASALWVLGSYYAAQCLLVMGLLRTGGR